MEALSIGDRDARLFRLRQMMFGSRFQNSAVCPQCGERMEWEMHINDLEMLPEPTVKKPEEHVLETSKYIVRFRLPNSRDVLEMMEAGPNGSDPSELLEKCTMEIKTKKGNRKVKKFPATLVDTLASQMEKLEPAADIRMNITCPHCEFHWEAPFDIMSYLWTEIDHWAFRTLQEVGTLATAFGWTEQDILNMDAGRRQLYIEMIRS